MQLRQEADAAVLTTETSANNAFEVDPAYASNGAADVDIPDVKHSAVTAEAKVVLEDGNDRVIIMIDDDVDDDDGARYERYAPSVYAMSTYPRVQPAHQVEYPFEKGPMPDNGTIDSSRTLYAEEFDYEMENGREYCGDYYMPIDQTEQTRQYVIHQVYLKLFNLELTTVPLVNPRYILDVGTGIGEWAIGMAEKYPECEVFGTDIAPIQPTQVPLNIEFHIENAEDEWIRPSNSIDLVHFRDMAGVFSNWSYIYQQAYESIRPGGWIEVVDVDDFYDDNNWLTFYPPNSAAHTIVEGLYEAAQAIGKPIGVTHLKPDLLTEMGFVDVAEEVYDLGIGMRENSNYGQFWLFAVVTGTESFCLRPLTKILGWDAEYVRGLCERVAQETRAIADDPNTRPGFSTKLRVLTARKPLTNHHLTAKALHLNGDSGEYSGGDSSTIGSRSERTLRLDDSNEERKGQC